MKAGLIKIFAFLLLLSVSAEAVLPVINPNCQIICVMENEDNSGTGEKEMEKEISKDKLFSYIDIKPGSTATTSNLYSSIIQFKTSAFLSLPEIPPELA